MRCTLPRLVRKNSKLSLWSLFIKGMMVQLDFTPRFKTAYAWQRGPGFDLFQAITIFSTDWQAAVPLSQADQVLTCNSA